MRYRYATSILWAGDGWRYFMAADIAEAESRKPLLVPVDHLQVWDGAWRWVGDVPHERGGAG